MSEPYEVIWETIDGKTHISSFPIENHSLRYACDFCYSLMKMSDVVSGHVRDNIHKTFFASFDKTESL